MSTATITSQPTHYDGETLRLPLNAIIKAPWGNIRKQRSEEAKAELTATIKAAKGVFQAVTVRPSPTTPDKYELLAGYGRYDSSLELNLADIPVVIKLANDAEAMAIMLTENTAREDLSPMDEALAAQLIAGQCAGNYKEAAQQLGWTQHKLKQRLHLCRLSENAQQALLVRQPNGFVLRLEHADHLARLTSGVQDKILKHIIDNNSSPAELKQLIAQSGSRSLTQAKFDKKDCDGCPHNSEEQTLLFGTSEAAECSNRECYQKKTTEWLSNFTASLKEKFGTVILRAECHPDQLNTVSVESVGQSQYNSACIGCVKNAVVVDDAANHEGETKENQCVDSDCFRRCQAALIQAAEPKTQATSTDSKAQQNDSVDKSQQESATRPSANSTSNTTPTQPLQIGTLPKRLIEDARYVFREAGVEAMTNNANFAVSCALGALVNYCGYKPTHKALQVRGFNELVLKGQSLTIQDLQAELISAVTHLAKDANDNDYEMSAKNNGYRNLMFGLLKQQDNALELVSKHWMPTEERLLKYTKPMLMQICASSGFYAAYEAQHGEAKAKALFDMKHSQSNPELVKTILNTPFDWAGFAPDYLEALLKK